MSKPVAREVYSGNPFNFGPSTGTITLPQTPPTPEVEQELPEPEPELVDPNFDRENPKGYADPNFEDSVSDDFYGEETENQDEPEFDNQEQEQPEDLEIDQKEAVSSLFEAFKNLGFVDDSAEIDKGESVADFLTSYEKYKANKIEEAVKEDLTATYSKERMEYIDFLMAGGDPQAISGFHQIANLPIDDDDEHADNRKALILAMHKDRGLNDKKALTLYNTAYDEGEDLVEAKEAKTYFQGKRDDQLNAIKEAQKAEVDARNAEIEKTAQSLKQILKTRKVDGLELSETEARELESYMFNKSVITDIADPETGQSFKGKVSQYYIEYENFMKSPGALVKLAKFIKNNGNSDNQVEKIEEEINQKLIIKLNGFNGKQASVDRRPLKKNAFLT